MDTKNTGEVLENPGQLKSPILTDAQVREMEAYWASRIRDSTHFEGCWKGHHACAIARLIAAYRAVVVENVLLKGAMASQDDRERVAGKRCGVDYAQWGCDWPDRMADKVLELQTDATRLREACEQALTYIQGWDGVNVDFGVQGKECRVVKAALKQALAGEEATHD